MIHFKKLRIKNFLSYGNIPQEISLDGFKKTLVSGQNGNGKCLNINTPLTLRNKNTKETFTLTIGELFEHVKRMSDVSLSQPQIQKC
jgi:hypothetical protein